MAIVKTDIPMTAQLCEDTIRALQERYSFLQSRVLTTTACGRPVTALTLGTGPRTVLYTAAHHGNEWITATLILKFTEDLAQAIFSGKQIFGIPGERIARETTLHLVPMVNPDGVDLVTGGIAPGSRTYGDAKALADFYPAIPFPEGWKANLKGVDLNLQYPAGWLQAREIKFSQGYTRPGPRDYVGRAPLLEPEARALAELTENTNPALVLAYHTQGEEIYWQFEDLFVPGARELGEEFARLSGYTLADTPYNSSFAGFKDWFIKIFRRPGFTIEAGKGENPLPLSQFENIYRDNLGILVTAALDLK